MDKSIFLEPQTLEKLNRRNQEEALRSNTLGENHIFLMQTSMTYRWCAVDSVVVKWGR